MGFMAKPPVPRFTVVGVEVYWCKVEVCIGVKCRCAKYAWYELRHLDLLGLR